MVTSHWCAAASTVLPSSATGSESLYVSELDFSAFPPFLKLLFFLSGIIVYKKKKHFIYNHSDVFVGMMQDEIPEKEGICGTALLLPPRVPYSLGHFYA